MNETPRIVTRTRRSTATQQPDFQFTAEMIPDAGESFGLAEYRRNAWEAFTRQPMPTPQIEAWRRTDLKGLQAGSFQLPADGVGNALPLVPERLLVPLADAEHGGEVIVEPGKIRQSLAAELAAKGVIFTDLQTAQREHPELLTRLIGKIVKADEGKFAALAAALGQLGTLVYVPRGVEVAQPLHSLLWGPGVGLAYLSHVIVWVEEGASVTYVHETASPAQAEGQTLHAGIVELHVGEGANVRFVELQSWGENVWNFTHERARVEQSGTLDWVFGAIGSHLTKNFSDLDLAGSGATGRMSGFYFTDNDQHLDLDTQQNHFAPSTTSDLLYKGALQDSSRSVWQGMIYVAPGAMKTDGYQANRNLVLSRKARADSIPGLEILADDVRCTHGATVGKIDPDLVFYLRSRGVPEKDAERLVVEGFFDPIMQRIPFDGVRRRFQEAISSARVCTPRWMLAFVLR
ncbi:MAG TPA: Fe-S cluster assembly protein SufD [Anaerolineaceae bacterium]|nr:Fe-S cluster assembly protein SufD [Anaerolineaceae bacterium]